MSAGRRTRRVLDTADRLGYMADPAARRLAAGRSFLIGLHTFTATFPVDRLLEDGFPLVYIGRRGEFDDRLPYVGADYGGASADLVRHLHALGHRRILNVREPDEAVSATDRRQGFLAGLAAVALPAGPDRVVRTDTLAAARALQATATAAGLPLPRGLFARPDRRSGLPPTRHTDPHRLRRPPPRHGPRGGRPPRQAPRGRHRG
jgi:DNA-binding LacI/PurR family transcriptional regulator